MSVQIVRLNNVAAGGVAVTNEEFKALDAGKSKQVKFAHEFTFWDLPDDVPDIQGRLIRKDDPPASRWLQWQKSVVIGSRLNLVDKNAMTFFQETKHLTKPPQRDDMNIQQTGAIGTSLLKEDQIVKFTWSPSKMMDWQTCPKMWLEKHKYKSIPYQETVHTIWGTRVHKAAEDYMNGVDIVDLEAFEVVAPYVRLLGYLPGERLIEHKLSLDDNWKPAEWVAATARMILDFGVISPDGTSFKGYDYKTGKVKDSLTQMEIYAYVLAIMFPKIQNFDMRYIWLKEKRTTGFKVKKKELIPIAQKVRANVERMRQDWDNDNDRMCKNGLCRQYCGAVSCPYCGGRG